MTILSFLFMIGLTVFFGPFGFAAGFLFWLVCLLQAGANKRNRKLIRQMQKIEKQQKRIKQASPKQAKKEPDTIPILGTLLLLAFVVAAFTYMHFRF